MKKIIVATLLALQSLATLASVDLQKLEANANWRFHQISLASDQSGYKLVLYKLADVKTIRDPHAFVTKTITIPVEVQFHSDGIDRTLRHSYTKKMDWLEGKFSHVKGHRLSEIFDRYEGSAKNFGVGFIGLGRSHSQSRMGIVLSQLDLESPLAGAGILNAGLTNIHYEISLKPKSQQVSSSLVLEENGVESSLNQSVSLKSLEGSALESND